MKYLLAVQAGKKSQMSGIKAVGKTTGIYYQIYKSQALS